MTSSYSEHCKVAWQHQAKTSSLSLASLEDLAQAELQAHYLDGQMLKEFVSSSASPVAAREFYFMHRSYLNRRLAFSISPTSVTGILRRCNRTGTYHPNTINSLNNIIHTKMQDYGSLSEDRSCHADEDLIVAGEKYEPIHSIPARTELTRHKEGSTLMCSSVALERETLCSSMSPLSCFSTAPVSIESDSESQAGHYVENGIFELEL
jgi:hypothetical protein